MLFSLIFMRMSGMILLNPVLGRKNVPALARGGMVMVFTLLIYSFTQAQVPEPVNSIEYSVVLLKEFMMGYAIGFVIELFTMVVTYAGAVIDFQMGLSMATVYDPQTNAQTAITGSLFQVYMMLMFFAVDGHLALIKLLVQSAEVVPYGQAVFGREIAWALVMVFTQCIFMGMKFAFPIVAIELLTETAVGILMKMIPQINVFVVNIQAKILIGFLMLIFLFSPMSDHIGDIISQMLLTVQDIIKLF